MLWQYDRERDKPVLIPPHNAAVQTHFYSITDKQGNRFGDFEELLARIETESAPVIRNTLSKNGVPLDKNAEVFAAFVVSTFLRTAYFRKRLNSCVDAFLKNWIKEFAADEGDFNSKYLAYERDKQGKLDIPAAELRQYMLKGTYRITANPAVSMWMFTAHLERLAAILLQMRWAFLSSTPEQDFLCSDNPVAILNPNHPVNPWYAGLAQRDAE